MWGCSYAVVTCGLPTARLMPALQGHLASGPAGEGHEMGSKGLQLVLEGDWEKCISSPMQGIYPDITVRGGHAE